MLSLGLTNRLHKANTTFSLGTLPVCLSEGRWFAHETRDLSPLSPARRHDARHRHVTPHICTNNKLPWKLLYCCWFNLCKVLYIRTGRIYTWIIIKKCATYNYTYFHLKASFLILTGTVEAHKESKWAYRISCNKEMLQNYHIGYFIRSRHVILDYWHLLSYLQSYTELSGYKDVGGSYKVSLAVGWRRGR